MAGNRIYIAYAAVTERAVIKSAICWTKREAKQQCDVFKGQRVVKVLVEIPESELDGAFKRWPS